MAVILGNVVMAVGYAGSLSIWLQVERTSAQSHAFTTGLVLGVLVFGYQVYRSVKAFQKRPNSPPLNPPNKEG